jgi:hypothetical protein
MDSGVAKCVGSGLCQRLAARNSWASSFLKFLKV